MLDHKQIHSLLDNGRSGGIVENGLHDPGAYFLTALHYNEPKQKTR